MGEELQGFGNLMRSPEFKRRSTYLAEDTAKFSFKWIGIAFKASIDFIKSMISMALGR